MNLNNLQGLSDEEFEIRRKAILADCINQIQDPEQKRRMHEYQSWLNQQTESLDAEQRMQLYAELARENDELLQEQLQKLRGMLNAEL